MIRSGDKRKVRVMTSTTMGRGGNTRKYNSNDRYADNYNDDYGNINSAPKRVLERFPRFSIGERLYIPSKNRAGVVDRVEFDPIWGPQLYVRVIPNENENWVEEHFWFQWDQIQRFQQTQRNYNR